MTDRHETGTRTRRAVPGHSHVDRAEAAKTGFDEPVQAVITEGAWGTVRARDTIGRRERTKLAMAFLAATGNFEAIPTRARAAARWRGRE